MGVQSNPSPEHQAAVGKLIGIMQSAGYVILEAAYGKLTVQERGGEIPDAFGAKLDNPSQWAVGEAEFDHNLGSSASKKQLTGLSAWADAQKPPAEKFLVVIRTRPQPASDTFLLSLLGWKIVHMAQ